ncbi:MAG: polymer-forming cytoskeletal protein [Hyphomicrobiaceae bacterium]
MFTKKPDKEPSAFDLARQAPPLPPSGPMPPSMPTVARPMASNKTGVSQIGADLTVVGNLLSKGEVHIDGEIQGDVHAGNVVVGESARITGGLVADEIIVRGTVMGSIRGKRVVLQSSSKVEGDIYHSQLAIEQGAFFEGKSRRSDDPTAGVQRPDMPPNGAAS